jgi:AraC-like DNA-binding protein
VETRDDAELSEKISWARSHKIERSPRDISPLSRLSYAPLCESSLGSMASNAKFLDRIGPTDLASCILIVFDGSGEHSIAGKRFPLNRQMAAVHSSGRATEVATEGRSQMLSISIRQTAIVSELENYLGRKIHAPIDFAPILDMDSHAGSMLRRMAVRLCKALDESPESYKKLLAVQQLERGMVSHLVESHRHNYTRLLHRAMLAGPWQVRSVEEYIRANAAAPMSLGDLAAVAGVSARTLQYSFRRHRGIRPMEFLRQTRMEYVRDELLSSEKPATVSETAARWGFFHFGRFAAEYREQYGETPSATLQRSKPYG